MFEEGIPKKYILLGIIILVVGVYLAGYLTAPTEEFIEKPIVGRYVTTVHGECKCTLAYIPTPGDIYNGSIFGKFDGRIDYEGEKAYSNLTIIIGNFTGTVSGEYNETYLEGIIEGTADILVNGKITKIEKKGLEIPVLAWVFVGVVILIIVIAKSGILDYLTPLRYMWRRAQVKKYESEIFDEIKEELWNEWNWRWDSITTYTVIRDPEENPRKLIFFLFVDTQLYRIEYTKNEIKTPEKSDELKCEHEVNHFRDKALERERRMREEVEVEEK